jgi:hypothetical protein
MNKVKIFKYEPPYGGQSFKIKGSKNGFNTLMNFVNHLTIQTDEMEMELKVFEEVSNKSTNYVSTEYINKANNLFGTGEKLEWLNNIYNPDHKEYCFQWKIQNNDFESCIDYFDQIKPFPKYYIGPIQISVSYWFKWKKYNLEDDLFINKYFSQNHITLFLSKTNTIIPNLNFPIETINPEFISLYKDILEIIPIEMPVKKFRHYLPTKDEKDYRVKKLSMDELTRFEELIGKAKTSA